MNITKAKYHKYGEVNSCIEATIDGKMLMIPLDPANRHYQAIQEWAKIDGNTIQEAE